MFPVVQFKAKQRFIIEKIVERRDVLGQLIEESNLPNVAYKLEGLKNRKMLKVMNFLAI